MQKLMQNVLKKTTYKEKKQIYAKLLKKFYNVKQKESISLLFQNVKFYEYKFPAENYTKSYLY